MRKEEHARQKNISHTFNFSACTMRLPSSSSAQWDHAHPTRLYYLCSPWNLDSLALQIKLLTGLSKNYPSEEVAVDQNKWCNCTRARGGNMGERACHQFMSRTLRTSSEFPACSDCRLRHMHAGVAFYGAHPRYVQKHARSSQCIYTASSKPPPLFE